MGSLSTFEEHDGGQADVVTRLRAQVAGMQGGLPREPVATDPVLRPLLQLRAGGCYEVEGASLGLALLAGPSRAGAWSAVVGVPDFGAEAAAEMGIDLTRTVLVPDPGEHWVEAVATLIPIVTTVLLRPPARVEQRVAGRLSARLRKHGGVLAVQGDWPGREARLSLAEPAWSGLGAGHGRLRARQVVVAVRRGAAPPVHARCWLPAYDAPLRLIPSDGGVADQRTALRGAG